MSGSLLIPEGKGLELDYDRHDRTPTQNYPNAETWWQNFCSNGADELENSPFKIELLKELDGDTYLAMAINHFIGKNYQEWLDRKDIPDLGGLSPRECLSTIWETKRLRMLLMRMH